MAAVLGNCLLAGLPEEDRRLLVLALEHVALPLRGVIEAPGKPISLRLARWLLMSQDRFRNDKLVTTHEYVAETLGVRRVGITLALHTRESKGFIRSARSQITICDRQGLSEQANGSYGIAEAVYARLFGNDLGAVERA